MDRTVQQPPHRHNRDGSHDSICTRCFMTIASARDEAELKEKERVHTCEAPDPKSF